MTVCCFIRDLALKQQTGAEQHKAFREETHNAGALWLSVHSLLVVFISTFASFHIILQNVC